MRPRAIELAALYVVVPVLFAIGAERWHYRGAMAPVLWIIAIALLVVLRRDPTFEWSRLWRVPIHDPYVRTMLLRAIPLGIGVLLVGRWLSPERFLAMPRQYPYLIPVFVVGYPLLSAVPQGILWRVFFAHRYAALFPSERVLVLASAAAFSLAHLAFWNVPAIVVTAIGGTLFMTTYLRTKSMMLAALEHGYYGLLAFMAGMGAFLFRGRH